MSYSISQHIIIIYNKVLGLVSYKLDNNFEDSFVNHLSVTLISSIINNYSPKWRWLAVDIYRAAKRRGKYPTLATDTEVNSCFSIY